MDGFTGEIVGLLAVAILAFLTRPPRRGLGQTGHGMDGF